MTGSIDATPWARSAAATYARQKLARLERCDGIKPMRAGDEEVVCLNDQLPLVGSPARHDPNEIRRLREMAGPGWPR